MRALKGEKLSAFFWHEKQQFDKAAAPRGKRCRQLAVSQGESDRVQTQHDASSATAQQTRKGSDRDGIFLVPSDVQLALTLGSWARSDPVLLASTWTSAENTTFLL